MREKFLIGELAKIFNISTDTLRHYDKLNLLKPEQDPINNYRYYDISSIFKLSRILFLKNLGISLNEINDYINNKDAEHLISLLRKKDHDLDEMIEHLLNLKHRINRNIELFEHAKTQLGKITVVEIEARQGLLLSALESKDPREAKELMKENPNYAEMKSRLTEGLIFTSVSQADMVNGRFNRFRYFVEIESAEHIPSGQLTVLPKSKCVSMTVIGPYADQVKHYTTLIDWIHENGYEISGDSIENNLLDHDYSDSESEFITEIQIPIKKLEI